MARRDDLSEGLVGVLDGEPPATEVAFLKSWTVEVHQRCHRLKNRDGNLQRSADSATSALEHSLQFAQTITEYSPECHFQRLDDRVLKAFESGQYFVALFLNEAVRAARLNRGEPHQATDTFRHQLSARAGIRGKTPLDLRRFSAFDAMADARSLLYVANHQSNVGDFEAARTTLGRAREVAPKSHKLSLDFALREAQINRSLLDARKAIRLTEFEGTPYRQDTALVFAGFLALAEGAPESQGYFDAVLASGNPSWLYRAECWLGLGCIALEAARSSDAYRLLIASQYVYGFLGLQPMPHAGLRIQGGEDSTCLPFHVLRNDRLAHLSRERCLELRQQAIIDGSIRESLKEDLAWLPRHADPPDPLRVRA